MAGLLMLIIDLTFIPWCIETVVHFFDWKVRGLTREETEETKLIYQNVAAYKLIGKRESNFFARKNRTTAFVAWFTIHAAKPLSNSTWIHEMMHIVQYQRWGSLYITESIYAQKWGGGYNYGGRHALEKNAQAGLDAFNFEQQADIMEDYYRWKKGLTLQWMPSEEVTDSLFRPYRV